LEESVEDGRGARDIADELAPVFDRAVAGHDGASCLVPSHDDLEEVFTASLGELLHAHVVDDEEIGSEVSSEDGIVMIDGFFVEEVADEIEDGSVEGGSALLDGGIADGLREMGLAGSWWSDEEDVSGLVEELAGGEFKKLPSWEGRIEVPVELIDGLEVSKQGELGSAVELSVVAGDDFVLEDELEELEVAQSAGVGFLESDVE